MSSKVDPEDLESEARRAVTHGARVGLIVRLLATGEWVHGVTAYTLAGFWGVTDAEALGMFDLAIQNFAAVPGSRDALRGLGYARLSHLAELALKHTKTIVVGDEDDRRPLTVADPQYRDAIRATEAAYALALGGDDGDVATDEELDALLANLEESRQLE
jgi:hypothetical protein